MAFSRMLAARQIDREIREIRSRAATALLGDAGIHMANPRPRQAVL
jgi:hypothetical protein